MYRSTDGGDSWHALQKGLPGDCYTGILRHAMATDTLEDAGVYFGTIGGQLFYSRDTGEEWYAMPCTLPRILGISVAVLE